MVYDPYSVTVFTAVQHVDALRAVVGEGADYRLSPFDSVPLDHELENIRAAGGTLAVIDELHFFDISHMANGLQAYLNKPSNKGKFLRLILFCRGRMPGDPWLDYFAGYLGLYDIVYGQHTLGEGRTLKRLLHAPNERVDVLELLIDHKNERQSCSQLGKEEAYALPSCEIVQNGIRIQFNVNAELMR